jgi:WD40 repeat protein/DNA-binding SARP family transcriptional activator
MAGSCTLRAVGIAVLGPLAISGDGGSLAPRDRVVLAALAVRRGEVVGAAALADALWREQPPATWSKQIQASVVRLRRALGSGAIETVADGYRLAVPGDAIDAHRFERLVSRARELDALGASDRAAHQLEEALALWRGAPLVELDGWEPGRTEAARLEEMRLEAEEARLDAALRAGLHRQVLAEAGARVAEQPLREHRWALLALAQYQSGQQADALRTIRESRRRLAEELGLDPGPTLTSLEEAILQQDPALAAATAVPEPSTTCPYQGLVPYDLTDAESFFGRDAELAECLRRVADGGVLVVVGPSGSGKSSLVRAGVAAALERDGRNVEVITPGAHPMAALRARSSSRSSMVLVVDQCEEAITLCEDAAERSRFFAALADHSGPLVVALRADRLGDMAAHRGFAALVERGLYLLKAMDETGIRAAIEGPARRAGLLLEPGLVDLLVRDVEGEPGALPLLSHALLQTWAHREGRTLTVAGYQTSGGIRGAVAQSAELVFQQAAPSQRPLLRDLMLRLVTPSPEGEPVRSRIPRRVVATDADHEQVIELLVGARLVTSDAEMVELAHEALARAWPRLRGWLDDDADGQRILRHLALAAETWDAMGRPDSELYRGVRLTRALEWRERSAPDLNAAERDFLDVSRRHADTERDAARRRRRTVTTVLVAGVVVTATLAGIAFVNQRRASFEADRAAEEAQRANDEATRASEQAARANDEAARAGEETRRADEQAQLAGEAAARADQEADRARAQELAASAISAIDEDPSLAKLLAIASASVVPTVETNAALHQAWAADRVVARPGLEPEAVVRMVDVDPDGGRMVLAGTMVPGSAKAVDVIDLATDTPVWTVRVDEPSAWAASALFADAGEHVIGGVLWDPYSYLRMPKYDGPIEEPPADVVGIPVWDANSGEVVEHYDVGRCGGYVAGVSSTHVLVRTLHGPADVIDACDWARGTLGTELVDRANGARRVLAPASSVGAWGASLSGDGTTVAYDFGEERRVVVADVVTGETLLDFTPPSGQTRSGVRTLNHDGSLLLLGAGPIHVWDVATGERIAAFDGHRDISLYSTFTAAGTVLSSGRDGTMREWDPLTGNELQVLPGIEEGRVALTADGIAATISHSSGAREVGATVIDTNLRGEVGAVATCAGSTVADSLRLADRLAVFHTVCAGDSSATTYAVDLESGQPVLVSPGHLGRALAVAPDGTRFVRQEAAGPAAGSLVVHDLRTGTEVVGLAAISEPTDDAGAARAKWSPDGTMIAAAIDTRVVVWNAETGALVYADTPDVGRISIADVIFSPDSSLLIATSNDGNHRVLSTQTWGVVSTGFNGGNSVALVGFNPDGSRLLTMVGVATLNGGGLHWFDTVAGHVVLTNEDIHEGAVQSVALSSDGTLVATAATDGLVRVWDAATFDLVHEVPFGDIPLAGVAFVDNQHLVVTPADGNLLVVTIDPDELLGIVRRSLTRGFTATECARFGFDDECPTLAELRGRPDGTDDPTVLDGTYAVRWTANELASAFDAAGEPTSMASRIGLADLVGGFEGTYTVTFDNGRFDITHDTTGVYCTGSYTVTGESVRLIAERRASVFGCPPGHFLDATFALTDDGLTLNVTSTYPIDEVLFASRRLERVGDRI